MRVIYVAACLAFVFALACDGQSALPPKILDFNRHVWVNYSGEHAVRGKWGLHFDGQWRRADWGTEWQQYQLRPALNYQWSRNLLLTSGYVFTRTSRYGDFPFTNAIPEHRLYQQLLHTKRLKSVILQNRMRLEQRFIRYPTDRPDGWTYQNRYRHLLRLEVPLTVEGGKGWYLPIYNEILLGIPPNWGSRSFDQNRAFVGIGRVEGPVKVEFGYMNQFIGQRNGRIFEFNNTFVLSIISNAPMSGWFRR